MANYDLNRLNNNEFEHLVQSLVCKIFNYEGITFGAGPDGAREATFEGKCKNLEDYGITEGYHVVQAKFKECSTEPDRKDWQWAKKELEKEIKKFKDKKRDLKKPEVYLFFTNIQFTSVSKIGGRDKIEEFKKQYLGTIPKIIILGYDEICRILDNNRDVATSYASFILSGDILKQLFDSLSIDEKKDKKILHRFLNKEFEEDLFSKLEQANELTDKKVNLEKVFVDLNIEDNYGESKKFIEHSVNISNNSLRNEHYKMVFIGGPGQGKSTVTQYLAQLYRAYFLKNSDFASCEYIEEFLESNFNNIKLNTYRFPIRIILSDYSQWIKSRQKDHKSYSVLSYIEHRIEYRADEKLSNLGNFRKLLEKLSFIFIFDGLDEVPTTSNRMEVITEIDSFINHELKTISCDAIIIATTRPQGYTNEFDRSKFRHYSLSTLDDETCIEYLTKLVKNTVTSKDEQDNQLNILSSALKSEITSNLMRTPLQATIMAILVKSGGKPSKDKYSLFQEYYLTILKREKQKNVLKIINEHEDYINEIHYALGNKLQLLSQTEEKSSAYMDINEFEELINEYFTEHELEEDDKAKYTQEIMEAITDRLVFITENQDQKIGFAIRSTQEFFSAMKNVHNISDEKVIKNLKTISESIYWRNVFLFMVGYLAKHKGYILDSLDSYLSELNGSALDYDTYSSSKVSKYGSLLALEILSESILSSWPKQENKMVKHLIGLQDTQFDSISHLLNKVRKKVIDKNFYKMIMDGIKHKNIKIRMNSWKLLSELSKVDLINLNKYEEFWPNDQEEEIYYLSLFINSYCYNKYILEKSLRYLNWKNYESLFNRINEEYDYLENLVNSNIIKNLEEEKCFVLEKLFLQLYQRGYRAQETSILIYKLLKIESSESLHDILISNKKIDTKEESVEVTINNIQNLKENKLMQELDKSLNDLKSSKFLINFFKYLLDPNKVNITNLFYNIKEKMNTNANKKIINSIKEYNWQVHFICYHIYIETEEKVIIESIEKWGSSYEEIIEFENLIMKFDNNNYLGEDYLNYNFLYDSEFENDKLFDSFYTNIFLRNKIFLKRTLLQGFILMFIESRFGNKTRKPHISNKILNQILEYTNDLKVAYSNFQMIIALLIVYLLEKKDLNSTNLIKLTKKFDEMDWMLLSLFPKKIILEVCYKIYDILKFTLNETNLIRLLFLIEKNDTVEFFTNDEINAFNLASIEFSDDNLKILIYSMLLLNPEVYEDANKREEVVNYLIKAAEENEMVFVHIITLISKKKLNNKHIEEILLKVYSNLESQTIEQCQLILKYDEHLKLIFENKVIKFDKN